MPISRRHGLSPSHRAQASRMSIPMLLLAAAASRLTRLRRPVPVARLTNTYYLRSTRRRPSGRRYEGSRTAAATTTPSTGTKYVCRYPRRACCCPARKVTRAARSGSYSGPSATLAGSLPSWPRAVKTSHSTRLAGLHPSRLAASDRPIHTRFISTAAVSN